ncbi:tail fiber assembly protein [Escherichia coli]|uniref:tail fiber assembly protein n=1 Tax=Escherichia coli TaxID=562 RepID=UPI0031408B5E
MKAELDSNLIAISAGMITVYNYDYDSREYLSSSSEYLSAGVGIPANSCIDPPGENRKGYIICRTEDLRSWEYIPDHRGDTVYNIETGEPEIITVIGDYPSNVTPLVPLSPYDEWDGIEWRFNHEMMRKSLLRNAEQERKSRLVSANEAINLWQTVLQLGIISDGDRLKLIDWINYIHMLEKVDIGLAPDIQWPQLPIG